MAQLKFLKSYDEVSNIRTFVFETGGASWVPGQYQTYELPQIGGSEDDHRRWFTIASAPSEGEVHISTRVTDSKFKQTLNSLQPGDTIEAHDIEGDFTWDDDAPVVLVAGGIGVTPYRSMLLERAATGRPLNATLVQFNRDNDIPFRKEFENLQAMHPELQLVNLVGEPVTAESIIAHMPEGSQTVYLSGPEPMVDAVGEALQKQGVALKQDWFPGYSEKTM